MGSSRCDDRPRRSEDCCCGCEDAGMILEKSCEEDKRPEIADSYTSVRVIVEEIRTERNTDPSGDSDTVLVRYQYGIDPADGVYGRGRDTATIATIQAEYFNPSEKGVPYNKEQLKAHINNLQTILDNLT